MSSISPYASSTYSAAKVPTAHEINSAEFGPVTATAIDALGTAVNTTSAAVSFSGESLKRLASEAGSVVSGVEDAFASAEKSIVSTGHDLANEVKKAYGAVADTLGSAVSGVEKAAKSVESAGQSVVTAIGDAASYLKNEVADAADGASSFLVAGLSSL